jgi:hypothetical protein
MTYETWEFVLDDGTSIKAKFTDLEIEELKLKYPNMDWRAFPARVVAAPL